MSETIYDTEIAPVLKQIGELCEKHNLPFIATVKYAEESYAITKYLGEKPGIVMTLISFATRAKGNFDALCGYAVKYANLYGHSSACLELLGARNAEPPTPTSEEEKC